MNLLAIDTSGPVAGVCLLRDGTVAVESTVMSGLTHSDSILPMVEDALSRGNMDIADIDLFAAVTGPGSFTGVRIGVSLIKGMAQGSRKKCVGVDALEALALGHCTSGCLIVPIQDARAGQVYGAVFEGQYPLKRLCENKAIKLTELIEEAESLAHGKRLIFVGDGVKPNLKTLFSLPDDEAVIPPEHMLYLRPASVGLLAWEHRSEAVSDTELMPVYLRPPQAVRLKERMEGKK